jgi:hypothetical protein
MQWYTDKVYKERLGIYMFHGTDEPMVVNDAGISTKKFTGYFEPKLMINNTDLEPQT